MIRDLTHGDRATILQIVDEFYHSSAVDHEIPLEHFADVYDEMSDGGSQRIRGLAIEHEGQVVGFCSLSFGYSTEAGGLVVILEEAAILPQFRSHGLGQQLFAFVKAEYHGKAARLRLEVSPGNTRAIALYERLGFQALNYVQMILEDF